VTRKSYFFWKEPQAKGSFIDRTKNIGAYVAPTGWHLDAKEPAQSNAKNSLRSDFDARRQRGCGTIRM
jgi:hypothetical protein